MPEAYAVPKDLKAWSDELRAAMVEAVGEKISAGTMTVLEGHAKIEERMATFETRIAAIEEERRARAMPGSNGGKDEEYDLGKCIQAITHELNGNRNAREQFAPYESRVDLELRENLRALGTNPDNIGGFVVPTEVVDSRIIEPLRAQAFVLGLGAEEIAFTGSPVEIPEIVDEPDGDSAAENAPLGEETFSFGQKRAEPHTLGTYIKASRRFMTMSGAQSKWMERIIGEKLGLRLNQWALKGTGIGAQPQGIIGHDGVQTVTFGASSATPTKLVYQKLLAMETKIRLANALRGGSTAFAMAVEAWNVIQQLHDENAAAGTASMSFARKIISDSLATMIMGHKFETTTQLAGSTETEVIFGNWRDLWIGRWGNLVLEASNVASDALQRRQTHIAAWTDVDILLPRPQSFVVSAGFDTSATVMS